MHAQYFAHCSASKRVVCQPDKMKEMEMNTIVVLGASGDLAFKKTFPSIYNLYIHARLPTPFRIIGFARTKMDRSQFIARISLNFKHGTNEQKKGFLDHCYYMSGDYDSPKSYMDLSDLIATNTANSRDNRLFYMALPPTVFSLASSNLKKYVYSSSGRNVLVVEKPFGTDSTTCEKLLSEISRDWKDDEVFLVLMLRFTESIITWGKKWCRIYKLFGLPIRLSLSSRIAQSRPCILF